MRESAFRGTWSPNKRPYVVVAPDAYVAFQGETSVIGCGECLRQISINDYVTGISTEASVDSPPGSSTINLSIPDNDVNDFYVDGQFLIVPMMEVEIYAKGYFLVGGFPQYYKIFWGIVQTVSKNWSGGSTTITISCKDILRWWEITLTTINPAYINQLGSSAGRHQFWGSQFAGMNPYTIIISLAKEAMGDFSSKQSSFVSLFPEKGPEGSVIGSYAINIMKYWQLKFGNLWNALVVYGTSGQSYSFTDETRTLSPNQISAPIFKSELAKNKINQESTLLTQNPDDIIPFKNEVNKTSDFELFQNEQQSKLALAMTCREYAGYEFYCDTTGDIIFKPPFYNLNVLPNKPVSWIQDFEIIDDGVTDSEAEVYTHITASGNTFGGHTDYGVNDDFTTTRAGVYDFHLLRRYGWRRFDYQCEWVGNPRKLIYHLLDYLDRLNAKRQQGSITIPMRPELRMGFPIWFPKYDSFFYIQGISHQYSVGGQATTTLTLIAKRSKFIAPSNIGTIEQSDVKGDGKTKKKKKAYIITFPTRPGSTTGQDQNIEGGDPVIIKDPKTGKMLGYPNVVMVFRSPQEGQTIRSIIETMGEQTQNPVQTQKSTTEESTNYDDQNVVTRAIKQIQGMDRKELIDQLRAHRYEAGMSNVGAYDYAFDVSRSIKELEYIPVNSVVWGSGSGDNEPASDSISSSTTFSDANDKTVSSQIKSEIDAAKTSVKDAQKTFTDASTALFKARKLLDVIKKRRNKNASKTVSASTAQKLNDLIIDKGVSEDIARFLVDNKINYEGDPEVIAAASDVVLKQSITDKAKVDFEQAKSSFIQLQKKKGSFQRFASLNMMVRPVSDEFGFEVIGHYKYGRGSFIDRGQLKINTGDPQHLANELNIQFAPSGGFMTDGPVTSVNSGSVVSFSDAFEKMQPEDYATGASFKGYASSKDGSPTNVVQTSQNTYTNLVNANTGKSTFVEADALRKSRTLGELSPTLDLPGLDSAHKPCDCGLRRGDWLSVLPASLITELVNGKDMFGSIREPLNKTVDPEVQTQIDSINQEVNDAIIKKLEDTNDEIDTLRGFPLGGDDARISALQAASSKFTADQDESRKQRIDSIPRNSPSLSTNGAEPDSSVFGGDFTKDAFFEALQVFLEEKFTGEYNRANAPRERAYTAQGRGLNRNIPGPITGLFVNKDYSGLSPLEGNSDDNVLGDPSDPLFGAASRGDPDALKALEQKANFNFGSTQKALGNLSKAWDSEKSKLKTNLKDIHPSRPSDTFKASTSGHVNAKPGQTQPYGQPLPSPTIISQADVSHLKSITVGSTILNAPVILSNDLDSESDSVTIAPVSSREPIR